MLDQESDRILRAASTGVETIIRSALWVLLCLHSPYGLADSKIFAYRLFNRINGTPPPPEKLAEIAALIDQGKFDLAGLAAVNDPSGNFYNITLRDIFTRWTNTDQSPRRPLNDAVTTAIGLVRDDVPFGQFLYEDIVYVAEGQDPYSLAGNDMYVSLADRQPNFVKTLKKTTQTGVAKLLPEAAAGVFSLRGFAEAFYSAGTNRRAVSFTMKNFMCRSMESLADTSRPDVRIRRDVSRAPGGYANKFRNECAGCHAGMDAFGGAFTYYDFDMNGSLVITPGSVHPKFNRNASEFPDGYVTSDDSWVNMWAEGRNKSLGWGSALSGTGARSFGEMLATSQGFASCMAETAVEAMCARKYDPNISTAAADKDAIDAIAQDFKTTGNLKAAYIKAAVYCSK